MLKVVTPHEMSRIENLAYQDGYSEDDFMDHAGSSVADIIDHFNLHHGFGIHHILLLCGKGNNGGDAYVAGSELIGKGYSVKALQLGSTTEMTRLCKKNQEIFLNEGGQLLPLDDLSSQLYHQDLLIDGIFGTGFHGVTKPPYDDVIELVNSSNVPIIAIDIPSGLNGETGSVEGSAIKAAMTIYLELPKLGFFLNHGWNHIGKLERGHFGLPEHYIQLAQATFFLVQHEDLILPHITPNRHKYQAGQVVGIAGSPSMPGAALLSSLSALRGGAGMVRLLHPEGMENQLADCPYELIKVPYKYDDLSPIFESFKKTHAVFIGPGLGVNEHTEKLVNRILTESSIPCVVDADALTIISKKFPSLSCPVVLTPHVGEMSRLMQKNAPVTIHSEFLDECKSFAKEHNITLILKGAPSFIFHPDMTTLISPFGNPGMATAGSGDVLTGLLASLIAQGLTTYQAAVLGVALHGIAGEFAAQETTPYNMIASDIIENFFLAYRSVSEE